METKEMKRKPYVSPQIEVIPMETEGVISTSGIGGVKPLGPGGGYGTQVAGRRGYNSASSSDLEDLINDILTVEQ